MFHNGKTIYGWNCVWVHFSFSNLNCNFWNSDLLYAAYLLRPLLMSYPCQSKLVVYNKFDWYCKQTQLGTCIYVFILLVISHERNFTARPVSPLLHRMMLTLYCKDQPINEWCNSKEKVFVSTFQHTLSDYRTINCNSLQKLLNGKYPFNWVCDKLSGGTDWSYYTVNIASYSCCITKLIRSRFDWENWLISTWWSWFRHESVYSNFTCYHHFIFSIHISF